MNVMKFPKITFGIIVLNGEPFTRYCLRSLYPFAHQIIVVEGAVRSAGKIATPQGHSIDGTLDQLYRFKTEEDVEDKVHIVTRNGFWSEKDEQSQAYADLATGNYLWQVDIDEFYHPKDMERILQMLKNDATITAISFKQITFWGGFDYLVDGWYLRRGAAIYHRLFKWGANYQYVTHRPPTVQDAFGTNLRTINWVHGEQLAEQGILLYHYSLVFPQQVYDKCTYYQHARWARHARLAKTWAEENFLRLEHPFQVHNVYTFPSWLERFQGTHSPQIQALQNDICEGRTHIQLRQTDDIEALLKSSDYKIRRTFLKLWEPYDRKLYSTDRYFWLKRMLPVLFAAVGKIQRKLGRYLP